jgi:hypothetical protein
LHAPILVRPVSVLEHARARDVRDISLGGIRTYADEAVPPGRRLEVELLFDDAQTLVLQVRVAWVTELPEAAPARFEVGLEILAAESDDLALLTRELARTAGKS